MLDENIRFTQNREISWLKFNERVLSEAMDETVPLIEKLKFISIFSSNLDEFFMIRVGSLFDLMDVDKNKIDKRSGLTTESQVQNIYKAVSPLYKKKDFIYADVKSQLQKKNIFPLRFDELTGDEKKEIKRYFLNYIVPVLSPQIVDSHHPFPNLQNTMSYIGCMLDSKEKHTFGLIQIPQSVQKVYYFEIETGIRYIRCEDVILEFANLIFENYSIKEKVKLRVTRNADINLEDEVFDIDSDFRNTMKQMLKKRKRLSPVRLELSNSIGHSFVKYLGDKLHLKNYQIFVTSSPMSLSEAFSLSSKIPKPKRYDYIYPPFSPQMPIEIDMEESLIKQVQKKDLLLSYPYESMDPFVKLIDDASEDPSVIAIKITIYRLASKAKLVEYLCKAAENGKEVTVLIELRARFDEQNNIDWSERLEEAGCTINYGFDGYKVHSKICLITRKERNEIKYITQVATGNYNEKTAELYTDLSLMTYNQTIGRDASAFFRDMGLGNLDGRYEAIVTSPYTLKPKVLELIDEEIKKGNDGRILIKINSLTDIEIIDKLREASKAGVKINMIIRGICCILPGIAGETENIKIISVVGRFLEHSRVYCFGFGDELKMYISSADFMTRNTERRVEVACPIYDEDVKQKIMKILESYEFDNVKARILLSSGDYIKPSNDGEYVNCQEYLMNQALNAKRPPKKKKTFFQKLFGK